MSAQTILVDGKISEAYFAATTPNFSVSTVTCSTINSYPLKTQWLAAGNVSTTRDVGGEQFASVDAGPNAPALFSLIISPSEPIALPPRVYVSSISSTWATFFASGDAPGANYNWVAYPLFAPTQQVTSTMVAQ